MRTHTRKHGMIFVAALLAMLGMVLIGTSFVASATQQLRDARREFDYLHATAMADAGLNYFIWKQRYSGDPVTQVYSAFSVNDVWGLSPTGTPAPQVGTNALPFGEDQAAVWLFRYMPVGAELASYQIVSKGYCRGRERIVRAVLQGPKSSTTGPTPPWLDYAIFADSSMIISNSTDVSGNIASNGSVVLDTSGGSQFNGNVRSASWVKMTKSSTSINGSLLYGTVVYDNKNRIISDDTLDDIFTGGGSPIPDPDKTIPVDGMNQQLYADWAEVYGEDAYYDASSLSDPSLVTTPILYVNADNAPGYSLNIRCDLPGPLTIFVNGNVTLHGSVVIGTATTPVAIIATGNIISNGSPTVYGMIWANGTLDGGTPNIYGSVRCQVLGNFQGNPQLYWQEYPGDIITPPDFSDLWTEGSWELL